MTVLFGAIMLAISMLTVRYFNGGQPSPYMVYFQHFGATPSALVDNFVRHPLAFTGEVFQMGNLYYVGLLLLGLCFLPLLSPETLLLAAPLLLINFLSGRPGMHTIEEYYNAFLTPFLFLGAIIGFGRMEKRWFSRWFIRVNLPLWALTGLPLSPLARPVAELYSTKPPPQAVAECRAAAALPPLSASVTAQMALGSHFSARTRLYAFPNPFAAAAYGGTREALQDVESITGAALPPDLERAIRDNRQNVEYVALCPRSNPFPLSDDNYTHIIVALLQSRYYETAYVGSYVMVLRRVQTGRAALTQLALRSGMPVETAAQIEAAYWHWLAAQYSPPERSAH